MEIENLSKGELRQKMVFNLDAQELLKNVIFETGLKKGSMPQGKLEEERMKYGKALKKLRKDYREMAGD